MSKDGIHSGLTASMPVLDTEAVVGQWQPIETAPSAGEYLVFQPHVPHPRDRQLGLKERVTLARDAGRRKSTHWMPLPPPPRDDGNQAAGYEAPRAK